MKGRLVNLSRLVCGALIAVLMGLWIASVWWEVRWTSDVVEVGVGHGQAWVYARQENWPPARAGWTAEATTERFRWLVFPEAKYFRCFFVPLWIVAALPAGMWIWLRARGVPDGKAVVRLRVWRLMKRLALFATLLVVMVWWISLGRNVAWLMPSKVSVEVTEGAMVFCWSESALLPRFEPGLQLMLPRRDAGEWWSRARGAGYEIFVMRIALIAVVPVAIAMWAWWMERRAAMAGRGSCGGCGYPRSGLDDSAPCPECGRTSGAGVVA